MPVPNKMQDLSTLAASNSPAGSDAIGNSLDDYIRATQAIVRSTNAMASASIASASTTDLGTADAESVQITGTTTITSLGTSVPGLVRECRFAGALTITNSTAIVLPGNANITTAAGDVITFRSLGSGNWAYVSGTKGGFLPLTGGALSGDLQISKATPTVILTRPAGGTDASVRSFVGANLRWNFILGNATTEAGSNTGSDLALFRFNDAGTALGTVVTINRATGSVAWESRPTFNGATPWDSANLNPSAYLPLVGGAMTGSVSITTTTNNLFELLSSASYTGQFFTNGAVRWLTGAANFSGPPAGITGGAYFIYEWPNGIQRFAIAPNGGSISMQGNVVVSGGLSATTVTATSDERLKDLIGVHEPRDLTGIDIYEFTWKESGVYAISPVAQKVRTSAPEYVVELDNDAKTLTVDKAGLALERVAFLEGVLRKAGLL